MAVWKAAKYLLVYNELYNHTNIQIDTDWLNGQHDENFEDNGNTVDHTVSSANSQVKIKILILTRTMIHMMN